MSVLLLLMPACRGGGGMASEPTKGEVYVYVAAPLSGFQANGGQTVVGGARLMAERLNKAGGLLGYKVVVIELDDEADSDVAVAVAEEVRQAVQEGKRVIGVIGHYNSGQTLAAMEVYKDLPLVVITPTASGMSINPLNYSNFFRVNANNEVQAQADAKFLVDHLGAKRVAVLYNDDETYGIDLGRRTVDALRALGAEVVLERMVALEQSEFDEEVRAIAAADPDAIFYAGYEIEAPYLRADLVHAGITIPFLASDGAFLSATIDESEGTAEGMYVSAFAPSPAQAVDEDWIREYQEVERRNPDTYSINGYSALEVLAEGVKKAGKFDAAQVAAAIRSLNIETPVGRISYDAQGEVSDAPIYIFQVQDEEWVQVYPIP
ncbi:MAG: branched-chain amino acid ABC transporter substrate-binding protein [Anaerolineae bacterium]|nr:branched-chain amino acid ABC transporter substrate-binding protein [Anaerolineae bacterium]